MFFSAPRTRFATNCLRALQLLGGVLILASVIPVIGIVRDWLEVVPDTTGSVWMDTALSPQVRAADLLAHMTLREKIGQMTLVEKNSVVPESDIARYAFGGLLSGAGAQPATNTNEGWSTMIETFQASARTSRLGIPLWYGADAVHGHALVPGATVFPHQIGLGATGDADLVAAIARATAADLRATGVNWNYAPNLDLPQDIRWGRMYEAFSDDPILVSRLGAAYVRGLQESASGAPATLSSLKHFVGLGGMQWNTSSNKNFHIDQGETPADDVALRTAYLKPFAASIDAGALSVMVGLNGWGDRKLVNQTYLITDVLKGELEFPGFVVSDWYGLYEGNGNRFLATVRGINAGIDMVMVPFEYVSFMQQMVIANRLGFISTERIDDAVLRILQSKFSLGLFDGAPSTELVIPFSDHAKLARTAVAQSLVLLKNDAAALPITAAVRTIRVAGSAADNVGMQSGAWTVEWQGVDGNWLPRGTSILAGIKKRAPESTQIEYSTTGTFVTTAKKADLGIAVVGEAPYAEGWGDRSSPVLTDTDLQVIKNLQASCKKVVVVLVSGRPVLIANEVASFDALVAAWLPGTAGEGVADVLFGDRNFMGTLPVPWPKTVEQLPLTLTGDTADGTSVLFPRYSGLSY